MKLQEECLFLSYDTNVKGGFGLSNPVLEHNLSQYLMIKSPNCGIQPSKYYVYGNNIFRVFIITNI